MVSTMVCVHTILQDNRHQFNMGLLGAYDPILKLNAKQIQRASIPRLRRRPKETSLETWAAQP